jgi:hypothetical protein
MHFEYLSRKIWQSVSRHLTVALFFCVTLLMFMVTCHPLGVSNHMEIVGMGTECCTDHSIGGFSDSHESIFSQATIGRILDFSIPDIALPPLLFTAFFAVLAVSLVTIKQRNKELGWLWAKFWPFAWNGGYLPYFSPMRDA